MPETVPGTQYPEILQETHDRVSDLKELPLTVTSEDGAEIVSLGVA